MALKNPHEDRVLSNPVIFLVHNTGIFQPDIARLDSRLKCLVLQALGLCNGAAQRVFKGIALVLLEEVSVLTH